MPVQALRSIESHFDSVLRHVRPKRLASEMKIADKAFFFRYFKGYRPEKIGRGRLRKIAQREIFGDGEGHELYANLVIVHWNEANRALYRDTVKHVQAIDEDVEAIERIDDLDAHRILDDLLERYDRDDVYVCVRLNGVRFGEEVIDARLIRGEPAPSPEELAAAKAAAEAEAADEAPADHAAQAPAAEETAEAPAAEAPDETTPPPETTA